MTRKQNGILFLLSLMVLALGLLLSRRVWVRLDLTKNKVHSISEVSRKLYTEIPDQVLITYYVSDRLARIHPLPGEIEDMLREYAAYSRGKIRLLVRDPVKSELAARVEQMGIIPQQIQTVEKDQASVATVYSGIVIEYLDQTEVLPLVFSLDTLEYDLSSRIRSLVSGVQRELGIILGDADKSWADDFGYLNQTLLSAGYRIRQLLPGEEIPESLPALFVIGGTEELDEWSLYRIDRYIQTGGRVLFALESVHVDAAGSLEARLMNDQGLLAMVSFYGATVEPALVLDRSSLTLPYQTLGPSGTMQFRLVRYPFWTAVPPQNGNPEHPLSAAFEGLDLFWASPISLNPQEHTEAQPLFSSTPDAWRMTKGFSVSPETEYLFYQEEADTRGSQMLAAALGGKFESWFAGVPKPVREGSDEMLPDLPVDAAEARIIVIGDADFGTNLLQFSRSERNLSFLLQAADWLGNDDDVISIGRRNRSGGRLDKISGQDEKNRVMNFSRTLNVFFIPLGVIFFGFFRSLKRRREAESKERNDGV
ncbi:GldG family protein [Treponema sp. OttesenSCG-928-L16]|nr:GldG family protein [Treponema sp. OttesenSCG-928-L16]